jgi:hypothetical protein
MSHTYLVSVGLKVTRYNRKEDGKTSDDRDGCDVYENSNYKDWN